MRAVSLALIALAMVGCAADTTSGSSGPGTGGAGGKADGEAGVTLTFTADWDEVPSAPLHAGDEVRIDYDVDRLPDCRGEQGGVPQWGATAVYWGDDGEEHTVGLTELAGGELRETQPVITVPEGERLHMYFYSSNRWGCIAYDSDLGANYEFEVASRPSAVTLRFGAEGEPVLEGALVPGGAVSVEYDLDRLTECRSTRGAYPVWDVVARYAFSGGEEQEASLTRSGADNAREPAPASIRIPGDATELAIGFRNFDIYGCEAWEPSADARYTFPL